MTRVAEQNPPADLRWSEKIPALVLLVALLFVGFWPKSITDAVNGHLTPAPVKTAAAKPASTP